MDEKQYVEKEMGKEFHQLYRGDPYNGAGPDIRKTALDVVREFDQARTIIARAVAHRNDRFKLEMRSFVLSSSDDGVFIMTVRLDIFHLDEDGDFIYEGEDYQKKITVGEVKIMLGSQPRVVDYDFDPAEVKTVYGDILGI